VVLGFDRQGWITVFAALLLALITLFTNDAHVDLLGGRYVISLLEVYGGFAGGLETDRLAASYPEQMPS
jgi:hypothetical protein